MFDVDAPEQAQLPPARCVSVMSIVLVLKTLEWAPLNPEADFSAQRGKSCEGELLGRRELSDT